MKKQTAINYFGNGVKLAEALGVAPAAVSQWGEYIPLGRAYQLQCITNGKIEVEKKPLDKVC